MFISKAYKVLNIDRDIIYALSTKLWSLIKTPLSLFFLTNYLTDIEQGFWYTFLSLGALSVFAELGFTTVITQFVSHEYAFLKINDKNQLAGDATSLDRLISLIKFTNKIYCVTIPLGIVLLTLIGTVFFYKSTDSFVLTLPWISYSIIGGLTLLVSYLGAILQGLNKVKDVLKANLIANVLSIIITWLCLYLDLKLWSLSIGGAVLIITSLLLFYKHIGPLGSQVLRHKTQFQYKWMKEILPLQSKFALSWISGYFVFHFIVPVSMYFLGAVEAGRIGITIAVSTALLHLAHSWLSTKIPVINMLVARKDFSKTRETFKSLNISSLIAFTGGAVFLILIVIYILPYFSVQERFLSITGLILLLASDLAKLVIGNLAVHLRAFKEEPFLYISIITAILTPIALYIGFQLFKSVQTGILLYMFVQYCALFFCYIKYDRFLKEKMN